MTKIVLHIGQPKTGSTSIQWTFRRNAAHLLERHGVLYPSSLGETLHTRLGIHALEPTEETLRPDPQAQTDLVRRRLAHEGVTDVDGLRACQRRIAEEFLAEVAAAAPKLVFISSELIWYMMRREEDIARIRALLGRVSDDVRVLVYLRRPDLRIAANYAQAVKGGRAHALTAEAARAIRFDDLARLEAWSAAFGRDRVVVRPFERDALADGDAVADALGVCGLGTDDVDVAPRRNETLDAVKLEFLRRVAWQPAARHGPSGRTERLRRSLLKRLEEMPAMGPRFALPPAVAAEVLAGTAADDADIARRFLGRADGVLYRDPAPSADGPPGDGDPGEGDPGEGDPGEGDIVGDIDVAAMQTLSRVAWECEVDEIARLQARVERLERRLARQDGDKRGGGARAGRRGEADDATRAERRKARRRARRAGGAEGG